MREDTLYLKVDRNTLVNKRTVQLSDAAKLYSTNQVLLEALKQMVIFEVPSGKPENYIFSVLKLIEQIESKYTGLLIVNLGESDFIIEYQPEKQPSKILQYVKTACVCLTVFFGAAFTIMTFNEDASVKDVFKLIYDCVLGQENPPIKVLEVSYAIGLPIGTIVFFNHFSKVKLDKDPTPLQIQLRLHEEDINTTMVENANREGNTIDVD